MNNSYVNDGGELLQKTQHEQPQLISQLTQERSDNRNVYSTLKSASVLTAASFILEWCPNMIIIFFLSRVQRDDLVAGFGLGIMWVNCFGIGFLNSLACGLETMVSQAFGANKLKICGEIYNKAIFSNIVTMIPLFFIQFYGQSILGLINNNSILEEHAGVVTRTMIPVILINGIYVTTKCFLNGQNIYNYQFKTQLIVTILHILWSYLFIEVFELELEGASLARLLTEILSNIILFSIITKTQCSDQVLVRFDTSQIFQCYTFLKVAAPIGAVLWLEWLCYQCFSMQASFLSEKKFEASVIMINFSMLYYQVAYGISIAATTYVGSEMGKKNSSQAQRYFLSIFLCFAIASFIITSVFLVVTQLLLYIFKEQFVQIFTSDKFVQDELKEAHFFLQLLMVFDSYQAILTGIVRGIGREKFACLSFVCFYFIIGQTTSYLACFVFGMGLNGIWLGIIIGATGYDILQLLNLGLSDWTSLIEEIQEKIRSQEQANLLELELIQISN